MGAKRATHGEIRCLRAERVVRRLPGYPQTRLPLLSLDLENLDFATVRLRLARDRRFAAWMSDQRVKTPVAEKARPIMPPAAKATNPVPPGKILCLGALAPLLVVAAVPVLFRANVNAVEANSTLNCYDSAGSHEPCVAREAESPSQSDGGSAGTQQLASWTTSALYHQAIWPTTGLAQPANWTIGTVDQPVNETTSAPAARRGTTSGRRPAVCGRHFIPCFFSALRRGLTHIASVAANAAGSGKAHL
jgi:hypothetical protein